MPFCVLDDVINNNQDLIILTGNYNNLFGKIFNSNKLKLFESLITKLKSKFNDRIYLEIQRHSENREKNFEKLFIKNLI